MIKISVSLEATLLPAKNSCTLSVQKLISPPYPSIPQNESLSFQIQLIDSTQHKSEVLSNLRRPWETIHVGYLQLRVNREKLYTFCTWPFLSPAL